MFLTKATQRLRDGGSMATFRLIPLTADAPFLAGEFDTTRNVLVLLSKEKKGELQSIPAITEAGDYKVTKTNKPVIERRTIDEWFEIHVDNIESIVSFIKTIAVNGDDSSIYMPYLSQIIPTVKGEMEKPKSLILEA